MLRVLRSMKQAFLPLPIHLRHGGEITEIDSLIRQERALIPAPHPSPLTHKWELGDFFPRDKRKYQ